MPKYNIYVNAGIEINEQIEAESEEDAHQKAFDLIGHRTYECHIEVEKVEE